MPHFGKIARGCYLRSAPVLFAAFSFERGDSASTCFTSSSVVASAARCSEAARFPISARSLSANWPRWQAAKAKNTARTDSRRTYLRPAIKSSGAFAARLIRIDHASTFCASCAGSILSKVSSGV